MLFSGLFSNLDRETVEKQFRDLYNNHEVEIRKYLYWNAKAEDVEEIFQDTFLKLWKHLERGGRFEAKSFLYKIASNARIDFYRKNARHSVNIHLEDKYIDDKANPEQRELHIVTKKYILDLPEKYREIFILFYKLEYAIAEIAEIKAMPEGTVKSRLHKARELFSENYKELGDE